MTDTIFNLADHFGNPDQPQMQLNEVVILPDGQYADGHTFTLPDGLKWSDLEDVHASLGFSSDSTMIMDTGTWVNSELIVGKRLFLSYSASSSDFYASLHISGESTGVINKGSTSPTSTRFFSVRGRRKRYATENTVATINVNGGNPISFDQRYEIDIASALGTEWVGRVAGVKAEIYYDGSSGGTAGWGVTPFQVFYVADWASDGVLAEVLGDKLVVITGRNTLIRNKADAPNIFNAEAHIFSAPCRLKVFKVERYAKTYIVPEEAPVLEPTTYQVNLLYLSGSDYLYPTEPMLVQGGSTVSGFFRVLDVTGERTLWESELTPNSSVQIVNGVVNCPDAVSILVDDVVTDIFPGDGGMHKVTVIYSAGFELNRIGLDMSGLYSLTGQVADLVINEELFPLNEGTLTLTGSLGTTLELSGGSWSTYEVTNE